jgi:hypothetical protein
MLECLTDTIRRYQVNFTSASFPLRFDLKQMVHLG